jgi:hypothetical protein
MLSSVMLRCIICSFLGYFNRGNIRSRAKTQINQNVCCQEMFEIFLFLIGEKLTKINLIHMCMFHIDDRSIMGMGIFLIDSSTSCGCLI